MKWPSQVAIWESSKNWGTIVSRAVTTRNFLRTDSQSQKRRLVKLSIAQTHTKMTSVRILKLHGEHWRLQQKGAIVGWSTNEKNSEQQGTLCNTFLPPKRYPERTYGTTDLQQTLYQSLFCNLLLWRCCQSKTLTQVSKGQKEGERRIPATDVQQVPHFFFFFSTSENHSQFSFLLAEQGKRNMRSNTTAEYDSRWQLAYVQKPKPLPGPCQPSHLQK